MKLKFKISKCKTFFIFPTRFIKIEFPDKVIYMHRDNIMSFYDEGNCCLRLETQKKEFTIQLNSWWRINKAIRLLRSL